MLNRKIEVCCNLGTETSSPTSEFGWTHNTPSLLLTAPLKRLKRRFGGGRGGGMRGGLEGRGH
jgi:hypothetical protein